MRFAIFKSFWCGLIIKIKNFEFNFGSNCINKSYYKNEENISQNIQEIEIEEILE